MKMLSHLKAYFTTTNVDRSLKKIKKYKPKYIYTDELDNKATSTSNFRGRTYNQKAPEAKPLLLQRGEDQERDIKQGLKEEKRELRVKVLMTKEEARRFLSKCREGGLLDFGDVAQELSKIPSNRVCVVDKSTASVGGGNRVLHTIVEEV